jgi:hypothetical protein
VYGAAAARAWNIVYAVGRALPARISIRRAVNTIAQANLHHALIFVRAQQWQEYARLGWLNAPNLPDGDLIFAYDFGPLGNARLIAAYPDRSVYYFDRSQPYQLVAKRGDE